MLAFTLCSNNYFAQAKVLAKSFLLYHPEVNFVIGLIDKASSSINYDVHEQCGILFLEQVQIPEVESLVQKYNITEFNTAVKPFFFEYLFKVHKAKKIIYIDPDIRVYSKFEEVIELLDNYNIVLTPQACAPIDDGNSPSDIHLLGSGIFNLGFIALSDYLKIEKFLTWWCDRLRNYAYGRPSQHMFYDQLWINLVPAFFDNYFILKDPGYNMAAWNMHEREITEVRPTDYIVNSNYKLRFLHYSGFKLTRPEIFCSYSSRFSFEERPNEASLFKLYYQEVMNNGYENLSIVSPQLSFAVNRNSRNNLFSRIKRATRILLKG